MTCQCTLMNCSAGHPIPVFWYVNCVAIRQRYACNRDASVCSEWGYLCPECAEAVLDAELIAEVA